MSVAVPSRALLPAVAIHIARLSASHGVRLRLRGVVVWTCFLQPCLPESHVFRSCVILRRACLHRGPPDKVVRRTWLSKSTLCQTRRPSNMSGWKPSAGGGSGEGPSPVGRPWSGRIPAARQSGADVESALVPLPSLRVVPPFCAATVLLAYCLAPPRIYVDAARGPSSNTSCPCRLGGENGAIPSFCEDMVPVAWSTTRPKSS